MGATDAFEEFYRLEHRRVLASLAVVCGSVELAVEATDEAFARAWERWDRVADMAVGGGWVYRVALNVVRRRQRRAALERVLLLRQHRDDEIPAAAEEVWHLVRALPERQRIAVVLRYVADLPEREVAAAMGVARGTVAATLSSARSRLGEMLREEPDARLEGAT